MRVALLLISLLLAGCVSEPDEKALELEIWGTCPHWAHGGQTWIETLEVDGSAETTLDGNQTTLRGYPLDLYAVHVNGTGVQIKFFSNGMQLQVHQDGAAFQPSLDVTGAHDLHLFLSPMDQGSQPAPGPLTIKATGQGSLSFEVQPWFKVCGA